MAASSSTSANPNKNHGYDVFLNHRGPDVKKTFASHLYRRLLSHGVSVFLDQQELQQGDSLTSQIERAIKTASIHVAIFSPRYAESPWCLNELILMWESKATIIPVFYNVKPTELRWTLRHDSATVEHWRKALSFVAGLSGFELEACNRAKLHPVVPESNPVQMGNIQNRAGRSGCTANPRRKMKTEKIQIAEDISVQGKAKKRRRTNSKRQFIFCGFTSSLKLMLDRYPQ